MSTSEPTGSAGLAPPSGPHVFTLPSSNAALGAAHVPPDEARVMLGEDAVGLWGFDREKLRPIVEEIGPTIDEVLRVPEVDYFPRGDVNKPFGDPR